MNISPELLQKVKDQLERFSDIPIPYGMTYERELELRARGLIMMIDELRIKEAIAWIEEERHDAG
jgi:hypothetical protein